VVPLGSTSTRRYHRLQMPFPRRDFLKVSAAAGLALAPRARASQPPTATLLPHHSTPARNIIFLVADGMSAGTLALADLLSRRTRNRPLRWTTLWNTPDVRRASCSTYSADGWVTDSSAAASAWGIGERVNNGAVNLTPDGREPEPILLRAARAGLRTGLVTTTRITHATPAGFFANCPDRDLEGPIGDQLLARRLDVALGGGAAEKYIRAKALTSRPELRVVRTRDELVASIGGSSLLGLFDPEHLRYTLDRPAAQPTLAEMTGAALRHLGSGTSGFILQIEGGRIDHAAHANDAAAMLHDMLAFDDAVAAAHEFASPRDDTLLVITTDHGCANPGLTLYGKEGVQAFDRLAAAKHSFEWIESEAARLPQASRLKQLREIIQHATGIALAPPETATLTRTLRGEPVDPFGLANTFGPVLGSLLANHFGVAFLSPNHTSDFVEVTALGPGSERLPSHIENTWLHVLMLASLAPAQPR
jgi:alkaline phosphatase